MADAPPTKRMSPLAIIILVLVALIAVWAFLQYRGAGHTPQGTAVPEKDKAAVMPAQASAPMNQQPASDVPWGKARDSRPNSPNEAGGTENTRGGTAQAGAAAGQGNTAR